MKKYILGFALLLFALTAAAQINKADADALLTRFPDSAPKRVTVYFHSSDNSYDTYVAGDKLISIAAASSGFSITLVGTPSALEIFVPYRNIRLLRAGNGDLIIYMD